MDTPPANTHAAACVERAEALLAIGRPGEALPWVARALAADPDNVGAHLLAARAHFELGDITRALDAITQADLLAPEDASPVVMRSIILLNAGKPREALAAAREAVRRRPDDPDALDTLLRAQLSCSKLWDARQTTQRLLAAAPEWPRTHLAMGIIAIADSRYRDAEASYRRALALAPVSTDAMLGLSLALELQNRPEEAVAIAHEAARQRPHDPRVQARLFEATRAHQKVSPDGRRRLMIVAFVVGILSAAAGVPIKSWYGVAFLLIIVAVALWYQRRRLAELPAPVRAYYWLHVRRRFTAPGAWRRLLPYGVLLLISISLMAWGLLHR